jgi:hypothetical protein
MDKLLFWLGIGTTQKVAGSKEFIGLRRTFSCGG